MRDIDILVDYFGHNKFRELKLAEKIIDGDVFLQGDKIYPATDIGNGVYTTQHFPHYRAIKNEA